MPQNTSKNTVLSGELCRLGKVGLACLMCTSTAIGAALMMGAGYNADPGGLLHLILLLSVIATPFFLLMFVFQLNSTIESASEHAGISQPKDPKE